MAVAVPTLAARAGEVWRRRRHELERRSRALALSLADVRWEMAAGNRTVALTFDDGPHPEQTPRLLDTLAELDVAATFFLIGARAARHPDLVRRIAAAGHAVGSHSTIHAEYDAHSAGDRLLDQLRGRRIIEDILGTPVTLFRPPYGDIGGRDALSLRRAGLRIWLWNVDPTDWDPERSDHDLLAGLDSLADGDVVVFHDATPVSVVTRALVAAVVGRVRHAGLRPALLPDHQSPLGDGN